MIKKIDIVNFRCIRKLEMDLEPLTVLVGPNASGKSTLLAALALQGAWQPRDGRPGQPGHITWHDDSAKARTAPQSYANQLVVAHVYQLDLRALRQPNTVKQEILLAGDGGNLANAFASLPRREQAEIAAELARLVDALGDVDVRPSPSKEGQHQVVFQDRWDQNRWFTPDEVSDGTMLVLAILVLQHQRQRPPMICLEEPERGLHPYLLGQVMDLIRAITQGKHGPATQFVLATQSAELLDHVQPHEVRFLERDAEGGVQARTAPVGDEAWADAIHEYENSVGQMWLSGSLGGVPGAQ